MSYKLFSFFLSFCLLFTSNDYHLFASNQINYISYSYNNFGHELTAFLIDFNFYNEEIYDLQIHVNNLTNKTVTTFNEEIAFNGKGKVYALIDYEITNFDYLINFYFIKENMKIFEFELHIEKVVNFKSCYLDNINNLCESDLRDYFSTNENLDKEKFKLQLINLKKQYFIVQNKFDLSKIKFVVYNETIDSFNGNLFLHLKLKEDEIIKKQLQIVLQKTKSDIYELSLAREYYLDYKSGILYEEENPWLIPTQHLFLPINLISAQAEMQLFLNINEIENIYLDFTIINETILYGNCYEAIYCLRNY